MSGETTKPPPDYARMYRDLDTTDPKWRDKIEAQTGHRPGEPVTPQSPKDKLPTAKPGTPTTGQPNVPKPMTPGGIPSESLPKIPGVTQPATPGQGPGVKPTELPKPNPAAAVPKSNPANSAANVEAPSASKVGEPVRPPAAWQGKEDARRAAPPPTDSYNARERVKPQEEAKAKAARAPSPAGQEKTWAEKVRAQPPQSIKPRATAPVSQGKSWAEKVRTQPPQSVKPQTTAPVSQGKSWAEKVSSRPPQTPVQNSPKPPTPKPPAPKPPTIRRGK